MMTNRTYPWLLKTEALPMIIHGQFVFREEAF
jgi:hypothetical protein